MLNVERIFNDLLDEMSFASLKLEETRVLQNEK